MTQEPKELKETPGVMEIRSPVDSEMLPSGMQFADLVTYSGLFVEPGYPFSRGKSLRPISVLRPRGAFSATLCRLGSAVSIQWDTFPAVLRGLCAEDAYASDDIGSDAAEETEMLGRRSLMRVSARLLPWWSPECMTTPIVGVVDLFSGDAPRLSKTCLFDEEAISDSPVRINPSLLGVSGPPTSEGAGVPGKQAETVILVHLRVSGPGLHTACDGDVTVIDCGYEDDAPLGRMGEERAEVLIEFLGYAFRAWNAMYSHVFNYRTKEIEPLYRKGAGKEKET